MKTAIYAVICKDFKSVTDNRQLFLPILLVPVILIVIIPTIFVLTIYFVPEEMGDLETLLSMLPESAGNAGIQHTILRVILNNLLPVFFSLSPS